MTSTKRNTPNSLTSFSPLKTNLAEKVQSQQGEAHDPNAEIDLTVEQAPVVGLVGNAQELESQRHFNETQNDFHWVHPSTAFGQTLEQVRK